MNPHLIGALLTAAIAALYSEAKLLVGDFIKRYG